MKFYLPATALLVVLTQTALVAKPLVLFVATNGNDQWSGQLEKPNASRKDGPFLALPAALRAARAARKDIARTSDGITILLRGGRYELADPLTLSQEDSGASREQPFTLEAYPGEKPVLSGGRRITGWKSPADKPGLWQAEVPAVREGKWYFRQLFVNGQRRQRARTPNEGFYRIPGPSPQDKPVQLHFKPGEIKKEWADDGDVEVIAMLAWADLRMQIRAVDEENHVATLSGNPRPSNREDNAQYYIENAPDGLDRAGEWYLNRKTGVLTYWAMPGEDRAKVEVIAPQLEELLVLRGDLAARKPVQYVVLRGLTFAETDWTMGGQGYADTQAAIAVRGDVLAEGAVDCVVEDCTFTRLGGYALEFGRACQRNRIVGNEMFDLGGGGIRLGETGKRPDVFEQNHGHSVTDNHIHHIGEIYPPSVGVIILQAGTNRIAHNHIHHLYYTAVSVGWNWGYQETPCRANVIEFNHLHDIGQNVLSDMGAIYTLGIQKGTVVRNNLIHDVSAFTYGGWGLYTDEGSSDIVLENNVVYRCKSASFHQHYGRDNIVRNNILAFGTEHQLMRTRAEPHLSFYFANNIVYYDAGDLLGSNWSNDNYRMDGNVYFDARPGSTPDSMRFAGATLEQWRARGHDEHSLIADPIFVSPQRDDFRLKAESPALKLGFQPIDLSRVGVRDRAQRNER